MSLEYKKEAIEKSLLDWGKIRMEPVQKQLVREITEIVAPMINMSSLHCGGFWLLAVRKWQLNHRRPVSDLAKMPSEQRARHAWEMKEHFEEEVSTLLVNPKDKQNMVEALTAAFNLYLDKYSERPS
ncbi:MAG: hypothetical protein GY854_19555 [Deltaproteobacteria bacterium]|nr:hypothetical protein [Deltaproteobacteria bacterium]